MAKTMDPIWAPILSNLGYCAPVLSIWDIGLLFWALLEVQVHACYASRGNSMRALDPKPQFATLASRPTDCNVLGAVT